ncbi:Zn-dependent alcohol dehydrogenase [Neorhizobium galegae bv. officinalis]|uniref:Zn-dependent alcohol dehydrogenase n=1 Tax=Neorhizobium galegae bv. officinalis TaxID=323656 RepID=A0A0T7FA27_NEOGA|nr:NAD(P)-dependent alcohol dehydrogenase [Neorhizobium galegae]CDZ31890.1 Zn-dependent alcohol dehydrogenase [Neorhizobium galegae bv. officinalis]
MKTYAFAATSADEPLAPFSFDRRDPRANDVVIEILYCGVCHSDLHTARNDWGWTNYPIIVGHEIVGRVINVGSDVTRHAIGDHVAVGTMVDSCQRCDQCRKGEEQLCREGNTQTFAGADRITGAPTWGGYAKNIVVREEFVLRVPTGLDLAKAGPLLCAGATTYSPLRTWNIGPGSRVGVIGMGGLGHMAIKLASAMGAVVTVMSRTSEKEADATELGADAFLLSSDPEAMKAAASSFDLIIDTVPAKHDLDPYTTLLDVDGTLCIVGQIGPLGDMNSIPLLLGRRRVAGSAIAGITQTQEMLDFCARKNILPEVEMIRMDQINEAFERLEKSDVRYRFVIDMASLNQPEQTPAG